MSRRKNSGKRKESGIRGSFRPLRPDGWLAQCSATHPALFRPRCRPLTAAFGLVCDRALYQSIRGSSLSSPVPPVSIVRAIADGKTFNAATNAKLAARTKNLEIDYTAVSLNRASRVRFRYKLENVDAGWRDAGSRRQAFYNHLPPGKYRFVVRASNGDNLWNEAGASMNMEVPPAFNQTTWFRSLCVLAAMLSLWGIALRARPDRRSETSGAVSGGGRQRERERRPTGRRCPSQGSVDARSAHAAFGRLAEDSPARQPLGRALELMGKASEESRIVLRGIRSSQLGDLRGLGAALSRVPQEFAGVGDVGFRVRVEGRPQISRGRFSWTSLSNRMRGHRECVSARGSNRYRSR